MSKYLIEGAKALSGTIRPSGNKNEALAALMSCLLTDEAITLNRVPPIGDVLVVCDILKELGVTVEWIEEETVVLQAKNLKTHVLNAKLCAKVRASILFLGPLLARLGKVVLPLPGGDVIGARRIDTHWEGMIELGAKLEFGRSSIDGTLKKAKPAEIFLDEPSVTATENLLLIASKIPGKTTLHNAACEPHVVGLCKLLQSMGANINGVGSNRIEITGSESLHGTKHEIGVDFMEVGSFLCLGALNNNDIKIEGINPSDFRFILKTLDRIGIHPELDNNVFRIKGNKILRIKNDIGGRIPTIYSSPWPAFPTDLMSVAIVAATQAEGTSIFFEKMFEGRMFFTDKLLMMGATIILCDPHRIVVNGPSKLHAANMSSPDVRAGMALLIAALIASGKSEIHNIYQIERGYYQIVKKLQQLGANIKQENS